MQNRQVDVKVSNKTIAVGTVIAVSLITVAALLAETYITAPGINPVAAAAALTVIVIGIAWFKKTSKS
ncbi:MAG: hypothetical protein ABSG33_04885 [Candidatus Bathyarchaeia archaeon]